MSWVSTSKFTVSEIYNVMCFVLFVVHFLFIPPILPFTKTMSCYWSKWEKIIFNLSKQKYLFSLKFSTIFIYSSTSPNTTIWENTYFFLEFQFKFFVLVLHPHRIYPSWAVSIKCETCIICFAQRKTTMADWWDYMFSKNTWAFRV